MKAIYLLTELKLLKIFKLNETQSQWIRSHYEVALKFPDLYNSKTASMAALKRYIYSSLSKS